MTCVLDRAALLEHVDGLLARERDFVAVVSVVLDRGLEALPDVVRRLEAITGPQEVIGRTGAASFAVAAHSPRPAARGVTLVARVQASLRSPFRVERRMVGVSASTGLALARTPDSDAFALLARADEAAERRQLRVA